MMNPSLSTQIDPPTSEHLLVLKTKFGHSEFRQKQWNVIDSVLNKKQDCIAIMATGHGKSICFQYAAVFTNKISIIISPLISLMIDQVTALNSAKISACYLGSAQSNRQTLSKAIAGDFNLIYATPELITSTGGKFLLEKLKNKLILIGIDEAHCVCHWGRNFRPTYRYLDSLREIVPNCPILAVTATATLIVRDDICSSLNLLNPLMICTGFDRPNLEFNVCKKSRSFWKDVEHLLIPKNGGSTIIYVNTRVETECYSDILNNKGLETRPYHAGLPTKIKKSTQHLFKNDKIKIVVATVAFGMGIDKADVRLIIQYGSPSSVESYYQQVGRAGRDGKNSKCYLFHCPKDFGVHEYQRNLRKYSHPEQTFYLKNLCRKMRDFINTKSCRRSKLIQYFEGDFLEIIFNENLNCCDNCMASKKNKQQDYESSSDYQPTQMEIEIQKTIRIKIRRGKITKTVISAGKIKRRSQIVKSEKKWEQEVKFKDAFAKNEFKKGESEGWKKWEREMNESDGWKRWEQEMNETKPNIKEIDECIKRIKLESNPSYEEIVIKKEMKEERDY